MSSNLTNISFSNLWLSDLQFTPTRLITSILVALIAAGVYQSHKGPKKPQLRGPRSESFLFGITNKLLPSPEIGHVYQNWEQEYGPVYEIPASMGSRDIVLGDPKAIAYLFSKDTVTYHQPALQRAVSRATYGNNLMAMEGEAHKRQRRALSSAFSISAIRDLAPVFWDTAYKLRSAWDSILDSSDGLNGDAAIIDVQKMNCVSLDSVGKAGFSHDFGTLRGKSSEIMAGLDTFNAVKPSLAMMIYLLVGPLFPSLFARIPIKRQEKLVDVVAGLEVIAINLLDKASKGTDDNDADRSALGVMLRSESASSSSRLSADEIIAQNMLILAGYETTAMTLTWAFIELARHADVQATLRAELQSSFPTGEDHPMYDQLMNLPYLDAFVCEVLRLHPALPQVVREVHEDDTIPLTNSILTASGTTVDSLFVTRGTVIRIPLAGVNLSEALWGRNTRAFDPGRWLLSDDDGQRKKEEVKGYRHLLTFAHGPRMCLARNLAIAEIKTVLSVLVYNFAFEFPAGPTTKLENHFLHPKVAGEEGIRVPVLVRRVM